MTDADRLRLRGAVKPAELATWTPSVYRDSKGLWTIGFGRLVDGSKGGGISQAEAEYLLSNDLRRAESDAETLACYETLNAPRQAVLIELCFNMGLGKVRGFTKMLAALDRQAYDEAAFELHDSQWRADVGPKRSARLIQQLRTGQWA